jgi:methylase of polypeptide subunit release factors
MGGERKHWERVYTEHAVDAVSWFEAMPRTSLAMVDALELSLDAPIIDVGGGASRLAAELAGRGYSDVTVADISGEAMRCARDGLSDAGRIKWVLADVRDHDFGRRWRSTALLSWRSRTWSTTARRQAPTSSSFSPT